MKFSIYLKRDSIIKTIVFLIMSSVLWLPVYAGLAQEKNTIIMCLLIALALFPLVVIIRELIKGNYGSYVIINSEGISFYFKNNNTFIKWDDIEEICIGELLSRKLLGISSKENGIFLSENKNLERINDKYILIFFRKELLDEIQKWYKDDIRAIDIETRKIVTYKDKDINNIIRTIVMPIILAVIVTYVLIIKLYKRDEDIILAIIVGISSLVLIMIYMLITRKKFNGRK